MTTDEAEKIIKNAIEDRMNKIELTDDEQHIIEQAEQCLKDYIERLLEKTPEPVKKMLEF